MFWRASKQNNLMRNCHLSAVVHTLEVFTTVYSYSLAVTGQTLSCHNIVQNGNECYFVIILCETGMNVVQAKKTRSGSCDLWNGILGCFFGVTQSRQPCSYACAKKSSGEIYQKKEGFSLSPFLLWFLILEEERSDRSSLFEHVSIVIRPCLWREKKWATIRATGKLAGSPATELKNAIDGTFGNSPPCSGFTSSIFANLMRNRHLSRFYWWLPFLHEIDSCLVQVMWQTMYSQHIVHFRNERHAKKNTGDRTPHIF